MHGEVLPSWALALPVLSCPIPAALDWGQRCSMTRDGGGCSGMGF